MCQLLWEKSCDNESLSPLLCKQGGAVSTRVNAARGSYSLQPTDLTLFKHPRMDIIIYTHKYTHLKSH